MSRFKKRMQAKQSNRQKQFGGPTIIMVHPDSIMRMQMQRLFELSAAKKQPMRVVASKENDGSS